VREQTDIRFRLEDLMDYVGSKLHSNLGEDLGTITDVIHSPTDLEPEWITVKKGILSREHLVPFSEIVEREGMLTTTINADLIKHSPVVHEHVPPTRQEAHQVRASLGLPTIVDPG
jgi:PRC-barrel domain